MIAVIAWIKTNKWFAAAGLALLLIVGWKGWLWAHDNRVETRTETQCQVVNDTATINTLNSQITALETANAKYRDELQTLQALGAGTPAPSVRLCHYTPSANVPAAGEAKASSAGPLPAVSQGPDIGPQLYGLADEADAIVAECRRATRSE